MEATDFWPLIRADTIQFTAVAVVVEIVLLMLHGWLTGVARTRRRHRTFVRPVAALLQAPLAVVASLLPPVTAVLIVTRDPVSNAFAVTLLYAMGGLVGIYVGLGLRYRSASLTRPGYDHQIEVPDPAGGRSGSDGRSFPHSDPVPIAPSLVPIVAQLESLIRAPSARARAEVVQLTGGWGSGKSAVLASLLSRLRTDDRMVAIYYDAWQELQDREPLLDIIEHLLVLTVRPWSLHWLGLPPSLLVADLFADSRVSGLGSLVFDPGLPIVRIRFQPLYERLVARCVARDRRLVILIDEMERTDSRRLEALLVTVRRSLDVNGATVVLAYAPGIVLQKVFSPPRLLKEYNDVTESALVQTTKDSRMHVMSDFRSSTAAALIEMGADGSDPGSSGLARHHASVASEKFLGSLIVMLPGRTTMADAGYLLRHRPPLRASLQRICSLQGADSDGTSRADAVAATVESWQIISDDSPRMVENAMAEAIAHVGAVADDFWEDGADASRALLLALWLSLAPKDALREGLVP